MSDEYESDDEIDLNCIMYKEKQPEKTKKEKKVEKEKEREEFEIEKKIIKSSHKKTKDKPNEETDVKRKRALILHLGMYLNQFPDELKAFKKVNLEKKTIEELEDLLKEFHVVMDSKGDLKTETQAVLSAIQTYEYLMVEYAGVQCQGLTVGLAQDPDTIKQIKLIILKYSPLITVEPEARLAIKILMGTMHLHTINSFNQQLNQTVENNDKIKEVNNKYNDI